MSDISIFINLLPWEPSAGVRSLLSSAAAADTISTTTKQLLTSWMLSEEIPKITYSILSNFLKKTTPFLWLCYYYSQLNINDHMGHKNNWNFAILHKRMYTPLAAQEERHFEFPLKD